MTKVNPYPKHALDKHIVPFELTFHKQDSVEKALSVIQGKIGSWPNTESIYVIDKENMLIGDVEFKKLLAAPPKEILEKIMERNFEVLTDHSHQETAIKLAVKKGAVSIPITDQNGHFLGIIDAGQIFKIMHEEHLEELMKFSGILSTEGFLDVFKNRFSQIVKARLPWLILGLLGGIAATMIVKRYELVLEKEIALAFFIPVIVYMNDAVGTQSETIFVRYAALEKVNLAKYLFKEAQVAVSIGLVISFLISIFILVWLKDPRITLIVGSAMFSGIVGSIFIATLIPWFLQKNGKDPAIGSGPFTTILQDLLSIVIYFSIASALL
ncbi:hypothetical protein A2715_02795 [Candidatus Woesebacteria bacterium RIFCSPHIGHO2_01_FULL_39_32]|uniref:CBS domain-containing protein n=1 Tax=Candidatus Woesebacteria bacterium RIFCSPLOWO2_01_FULL_39_25 TaxID=1802521 RepID=A0A1F8BM55_9BACT|nr:MAG: hypothetical protein A2124_02430 [Candidatus Woesebacteria bacterium GWB1_37_5]OGM24082.1 MAG: hypothetical protein A2715_02795 [Candidatus Woesebacteria bacterium RIFCSPHIGHO2_01_FULL_39_32]OGM37939.1 MAG: hypothetical protein A3F01_02965 [Candidatus Woesebacteria bacterium RIFCSPHIGHO2_12_FULL_38_11]OGM64425.1 MAG: hypothetical protein A2893_00970 [Candidatus Woesebacteria bacterium RIFCSPLOWO2_01_FULL_39_25]